MEKPFIRPFVEKRTDEIFSIGMQFSSPELAAGETIVDGDATVEPEISGGLAIDLIIPTENEVGVKISGGIEGEEYQVFIKAETTAGHILIGNILVRIIY